MMKKIILSLMGITYVFSSALDADKSNRKLYLDRDRENRQQEVIRDADFNSKKFEFDDENVPVLILGSSPIEHSVMKGNPQLLEDQNIEFYDRAAIPESLKEEAALYKERWIKKDFSEISTIQKNKYGVIVVDGGVWHHFIRRGELRTKFKALYNSLLPGGILFIPSHTENPGFSSVSRDARKIIIIDREQMNVDFIYNLLIKHLDDLSSLPCIVPEYDPRLYVAHEVIEKAYDKISADVLNGQLRMVGFDSYNILFDNIQTGYARKVLKYKKPKNVMVAYKPK